MLPGSAHVPGFMALSISTHAGWVFPGLLHLKVDVRGSGRDKRTIVES